MLKQVKYFVICQSMSTEHIKIKKLDIIFDGECLVCNSFLQFVDKNCRSRRTKVKAYSSPTIYTKHNSLTDKEIGLVKELSAESIVTRINNETIMIKSEAIEVILKVCDSKMLNVMIFLLNIFPKKFKNLIYDFIAKRRKKFAFLRARSCGLYTYRRLEMYM